MFDQHCPPSVDAYFRGSYTDPYKLKNWSVCRNCGHEESYVGTNGECTKWIEFDVFPYTWVICGCDRFEPEVTK